MFKNSESFLPQIINAVSENDQPKDLKHIITYVREQLNQEGENIKNISTDVTTGIALGLEYGFLSGNRNAYRLAVDLETKPKEYKGAITNKNETSNTSIVDENGFPDINDPDSNASPVNTRAMRRKRSRSRKRSKSRRSRSRSKRSKKRSKRRRRR